MRDNEHVSFETAKLLKENGFNEMSPSLYASAVMHNGQYLDFDEECELRSEGKGNEIEYVEGGSVYDFWNTNEDNQSDVYSRPTLWQTMEWLRRTHEIHIRIYERYADNSDNDVLYTFVITVHGKSVHEDGEFLSFEETCDIAVEESLKYIKKNEK